MQPEPPSATPSDVLRRALDRERARRQKAEHLLENKSRELFDASEALRAAMDDLRRNQKQMIRQEKLASLGVLSAGVAHEINNPVGFVLSNVTTLADYVAVYQQGFDVIRTALGDGVAPAELRSRFEDFAARESLDYLLEDSVALLAETREGLLRVKEIVEDLKNFARADGVSKVEINVNESVRAALTMARNQVKYKCTVEEDLQEVPPVLGSVHRLGQVVLNLLVNASQSAGENCWIRVATYSDGASVFIEVRDNGCGIPPENLTKLFTPFFTTKPVGEGTGLGLAICHSIVEEHGGEISVDSRVDEGTQFRIRLPVAPAKQVTGADTSEDAALKTGT
ncbi:MAG: peptidylprolyl isomerase [Pseudomonadales bacterium]|nr:peptidylprolyl isomerase [Pseudomonadales bacterium]